MSDMLETSSAGAGEEFVPSVVVLYCQRALAGDAAVAQQPGETEGFTARMAMQPCSSKVNVWHMLQIIDQGADAVELVCCELGSCQFLDGSDRAVKRVKRAGELLAAAGMAADRVGVCHGSQLTAKDLLDRAGSRAEAVRAHGPNPMKKVK